MNSSHSLSHHHPPSTLKAETATSEQLAATQVLQDKLQELETREGAEALKKERLVCERDAAANRVRVLESETVDARRRIGEREEKSVFLFFPFLDFVFISSSDRFSVGRLHQANIQYHVGFARLGSRSFVAQALMCCML